MNYITMLLLDLGNQFFWLLEKTNKIEWNIKITYTILLIVNFNNTLNYIKREMDI